MVQFRPTTLPGPMTTVPRWGKYSPGPTRADGSSWTWVSNPTPTPSGPVNGANSQRTGRGKVSATHRRNRYTNTAHMAGLWTTSRTRARAVGPHLHQS
jgi:hypothetical protein